MPYSLDDYMDDLVQADRLYLANWVIPYSAAYVEAHKKFKATLDDQKKYDKMMADLAIMAFSICIGAGMAGVMAKAGVASAKTLAFNRALDYVCNKNLERVFNVMHGVASSPAGSFIAGKIWDEVSKKIGEATKKKVTTLLSPSPLLTQTIADPLVARDNLRRYAVLATAAAHEVAADLKRSDKLTSAQKDAEAAKLRKAPLIAEMPSASALPANAAAMMELNMYMALILNNDMAEVSTGFGAAYYGKVETKRTPIDVPPSHKDYPRPYDHNKTHGSGFGTSVTIDNRVIRFRLGNRIWGRINALSQKLLKRPFYRITAINSGIGTYTEVVRAENIARDLQRLVYPRIARSAR